jgi:putative transposase
MELWAYCLMTNHVHLIVVGRNRDSLSRAIGNTHRVHSRRINEEHDWTGHLWANRFYSTVLGELHLWNAARYVESNPVRSGLVSNALDYRWSSARAHAGLTEDPLLAPDRPFPGSIAAWGTWLDVGNDQPEYAVLRKNTRTGRPTGSTRFVKRIEKLLGRPLTGRPVRDNPKKTI